MGGPFRQNTQKKAIIKRAVDRVHGKECCDPVNNTITHSVGF